MSLPLPEIERIFSRMLATYTNAWQHRMDCVPIQDIKTLWAHELSGFAINLDAIDWALENLPEHCPNVIEFRNLCRSMPKPRPVYVAEVVPTSKRLAAHMAQLQPALAEMRQPTMDRKAWAWRIVEQHRAGVVTTSTKRLSEACLALRIPNPPPASVEVPPAYRMKDLAR